MWPFLSFGQPADKKSSTAFTIEPHDSLLVLHCTWLLGIWVLIWNDAVRAIGDPGSNLVELLPPLPATAKEDPDVHGS